MKHRPWSVNADEWAEGIRAAVRREFEDKGRFDPPRAFLLATRDPKLGLRLPRPGVVIILATFRSNDQKQSYADRVAEMASRTHALALVQASEGWTPGNTWTEENLRKAIEHTDAGASLESLPGRGEALLVSYQHHATARTVAWIAKITRDADGKPALGAFQEEVAGGRFAGLMPETN